MYKIKTKKDFGNKPFLIDGKWVKTGFVVTDGLCNIIPGAGWFQTIEEAMTALHILCSVWGNTDEFWKEYKIRK